MSISLWVLAILVLLVLLVLPPLPVLPSLPVLLMLSVPRMWWGVEWVRPWRPRRMGGKATAESSNKIQILQPAEIQNLLLINRRQNLRGREYWEKGMRAIMWG